jgi:2-phosphosulfolactate phosphatase
MREGLDQRQFAVRMDWGLQGAQAIGRSADIVVIVDVLSFTTTVSVALDQGAEVFPYPWRDDSARAFARQHRAVLAVGRSEVAAVRGPAARAGAARGKPAADVTAAGGGVAHAHPYAVSAATALNAHGSVESRPQQVSLSPASIRATPGLDRIVLPSPNGSALASALVDGVKGAQVLGACLRNHTSVARWITSQPSRSATPPVIAVVAAGERWPDNSLRPATEDLWGAGAVIAALDSLGVTGLSPEARSAAAAWHAVEPTLAAALASCSSGAELVDAGFGGDVVIAGELDASACVPLLASGRFADAAKDRNLGT